MDTEVYNIVDSSDHHSIDSFIGTKLNSLDPEGDFGERSFYVADIADIHKKYLLWRELMPRIKPYYAVKCNNMPEVVKYLASLGTNFDCASKEEIQQVRSFGVDPSRILYANPCKSSNFVKFAQKVGVDLMTFDNDFELLKVAKHHPKARLILRIKGDEALDTRCKFNAKFGADPEICPALLKLASELKLNIVGVSFHNGSDGSDSMSYYRAIERSRKIFDMAKEYGYHLNVLDIGGGFPGDRLGKVTFEDICEQVNKALDQFFPDTGDSLELIAEPGRYFVASAFTLVAMVTSKRIEFNEQVQQDQYTYYLNDGVYGSFTGILYEHQVPKPSAIASSAYIDRPKRLSTFWGQTCDSMDCVTREHMFPELELGEWIKYTNMGAYSLSCATFFNGFDKAYAIIFDDMSSLEGSYLRLAIESANKGSDKLSAIDCAMSEIEQNAARLLSSRGAETSIKSDRNRTTSRDEADS